MWMAPFYRLKSWEEYKGESKLATPALPPAPLRCEPESCPLQRSFPCHDSVSVETVRQIKPFPSLGFFLSGNLVLAMIKVINTSPQSGSV